MGDFEVKDIETLDTHTFTSEMYHCNDIDCANTFLQLNDLRSHIENEHYVLSSLSDFKRQLTNQEFFYCIDGWFGWKKADIYDKIDNTWACHTERIEDKYSLMKSQPLLKAED